MTPRITSAVLASLVALVLPGCGAESGGSPSTSDAGSGRVPATPDAGDNVAPSLQLGAGYSYDADALWTPLTADQLSQPQNEAVRAHLKSGEPIAAIHLGERIRIYNTSGIWRPMTAAILDANEQVLTTMRLDLPPVGVVRGPAPQVPEDMPFFVRLTGPAVDLDQVGKLPVGVEPFPLKERRIGVAEAEFDSERIVEMGWGAVESGSGPGGVGTSTRYESQLSSTNSKINVESWTSIVLGQVSYALAGHSGGEAGAAPGESWWANKAIDR